MGLGFIKLDGDFPTQLQRFESQLHTQCKKNLHEKAATELIQIGSQSCQCSELGLNPLWVICLTFHAHRTSGGSVSDASAKI